MSETPESVTDAVPASAAGPRPDSDAVYQAAERRLERRRRGFWWSVAGMVGYVLLLVVVRLVWGQLADQRLAGEIEQRRAQGQPVLLEDFAQPAVADRDNAALRYINAQMSWPTSLNTDASVLIGYVQRQQEWLMAKDLIQDYLARHQDTLDEITAATALEQVDWKLKLVSPVFNTMLPNLAGCRNLARLLVVDALDAHHRGDPARLLQRLDELFTMAQRLPIGQPFLIAELVQHAIQSLALVAIEGNVHAFELNANPEVRAAAEALLAKLLDDAPLQDSYRTAIFFETAGMIDTCTFIVANPRQGMAALGIGGGVIPVGSYQILFGPAMYMDCAQAIGYYDALAKAPFDEKPPVSVKESGGAGDTLTDNLAHFYSNMLLPSLGRTHKTTGRLLARRRMAAIALAIRLYELDHGQRPATLAALVPEYVPVIPLDPFDPNSAPLRYLCDVEYPRLYSVGENFVDNDGQYEKWYAAGVRHDPSDLVFFLDESPLYEPPDPNDEYFTLPETLEDDAEVEQADAEE